MQRERGPGVGTGSLRGLGIAAVGVALFTASSVLSQPGAAPWGPISERVRELEARIARLELRLLDVERSADARASPPLQVVRADRALGYDTCDPPFVADSFGVRLLKAGCERHATSEPCDPMYVVDRTGIKTRRPGCEKVAPSASCEPPFLVDASGARTVRRECLDVGY